MEAHIAGLHKWLQKHSDDITEQLQTYDEIIIDISFVFWICLYVCLLLSYTNG